MYKTTLKIELLLEYDDTTFIGEIIRQALEPHESCTIETITETRVKEEAPDNQGG